MDPVTKQQAAVLSDDIVRWELRKGKKTLLSLVTAETVE